MISINVGGWVDGWGDRPGPSPSFPEHVDAQAGGVHSVLEKKKTRRNFNYAKLWNGTHAGTSPYVRDLSAPVFW